MNNLKIDLKSIIGFDLAGSPKRETGYAFYDGKRLKAGYLYGDEEILGLVMDFNIVMIDAPLSLPKGRESLESLGPHFRECDLALRKAGIKFFPLTLGPMRMLTKRAMTLTSIFEKQGKKVFETFPGAFYDSVGLKRKDKDSILEFYRNLNLPIENRFYLQDELDAVACWISGVCYTLGRAVIFSGEDGQIVFAGRECIEFLKSRF